MRKIKCDNRYSLKGVILTEKELNKDLSIENEKLVTEGTEKFDINVTSKEKEISSNSFGNSCRLTSVGFDCRDGRY